MWPFKKRIDLTSVRLSAHASDIAILYSRLYQLERFLQYELMDRIDKLEKDNKKLQQLLIGSNKNLIITITDCNK